jgi:hypothetical protein
MSTRNTGLTPNWPVSLLRAGVLALLSAVFGLFGLACTALGALLFVEALETENALDELTGAGSAYALLALGTLFLILAVLAFIANVLADQNVNHNNREETLPPIDPTRRPGWEPLPEIDPARRPK